MKAQIHFLVRMAIVTVWFTVMFSIPATATVIREGDRTYLIDRTGERWDITQAVSIGKPVCCGIRQKTV